MGVADDSRIGDRQMRPPEKGMADTPELLADALVHALGESHSASWLDPCAGSGQLISACLRSGILPSSITAIDLQRHLPELRALGVEAILGLDFLRWAQNSERRFDRIIANPPFVPIRELEKGLRRSVWETTVDGIQVTASANYWVAFLVAGMRLLEQGGCLAYILPAAWEYANYAATLRRYCAASFRELDVHRVAVPMFDTVNDGSILLVGRGYGKKLHGRVRMFRHETLSELHAAVSQIDPMASAIDMPLEKDIQLPEDQVRLGDIVQIRIGTVTGDARFFLLDESRRLDLGIPCSAMKPVLSKARHIVSSEVDRRVWEHLRDEGNRVWLFYPTESDLSYSSVRKYLDLSSEDGGCRRDATKIRTRMPWYRVNVPHHFDGFITGMSQRRTWAALNLMSELTITNTLYGIRFLNGMDLDEKAAWCLSMMSSTTVTSRSRLVREYPQGLLKLEPSDMSRLAVRRPKTTAGARTLYRQAADLVMREELEAAQALADRWLE